MPIFQIFLKTDVSSRLPVVVMRCEGFDGQAVWQAQKKKQPDNSDCFCESGIRQCAGSGFSATNYFFFPLNFIGELPQFIETDIVPSAIVPVSLVIVYCGNSLPIANGTIPSPASVISLPAIT